MAISVKDVKKIARLSKLDFSDEEIIKFTIQFNQIVTYVNKLNNLNTENVEPLSQVSEMENVYRQDSVQPSLPREEALQNAPQKNAMYFIVPKVLDG